MERKVIVITESAASMLREETQMTEYKFNSATKKFLHDLLVDPVNAQIPNILKIYGFNRSRFIKCLIDNDLLRKEQRIRDTDENGNPTTATMKVKFSVPKSEYSENGNMDFGVPKKNFERKLKKLYIKLFEKNVPEIHREENIDETTGCCGGVDAMGGNGAAGGAYTAPLFGTDKNVIRRGDGTGRF